MIEEINIKNFQSLQDTTLELGRFTVIVGPSSSGKSAVVRALKAVASNTLSSDYMSRGTKASSISVKSDSSTVTIQREQGASSVYKIVKPDGKVQDFKKLNRSVPAEVTKALGIAPSTQEVESINFAGQFDTPYLLKDSASNVARVLGELTNVSTIFAAVKEANRRTKSFSTLINLRKKDEQELRKELASYVSIGTKAKKLIVAKQLLSHCIDSENEIGVLQKLISQVSNADKLLAVKTVEIPSINSILSTYQQLSSFKQVLREYLAAKETAAQQENSIEAHHSAILLAETELHETLVSVGQCPTCNQKIIQ